jgi:hypothetical protein
VEQAAGAGPICLFREGAAGFSGLRQRPRRLWERAMKFILGLVVGSLAGVTGNFLLLAGAMRLANLFRGHLHLDVAPLLTPNHLAAYYVLFLALVYFLNRKFRIERFALGVLAAFPAPVVLFAYLAASDILGD